MMKDEAIYFRKFFPSISLHNKKVLRFTCIGNGLELYNYSLYGVMVPFLSLHFFPADHKNFSITMGYLSFAFALFIAPFGSIFWGWIGERYGRLSLLQNSLAFMALPTLGIALLPSFSTIGYWAPVLLFILRLVQGLSASGEVFGSRLYAMESLQEKHHGIASGYVSASGGIGVVLSMLMGLFITRYGEFYENLWRVPFLVGVLFYAFSFYIRYSYAQDLRKVPSLMKRISQNTETSLWSLLKSTPRESFIVFLLSAFLGSFSYMFLVFLNPFLIGQGVDGQKTFLMCTIGLLTTAVVSILWGYYQDYVQALDKLLSNFFKVFLACFPILFLCLLSKNFSATLLSYILLGMFLGIFTTLSAVKTYRIFDTSTRCRGAMFNYAFGCSLFGGLTPYSLKILGEISYFLPGVVFFVFTMIIFSLFKKFE